MSNLSRPSQFFRFWKAYGNCYKNVWRDTLWQICVKGLLLWTWMCSVRYVESARDLMRFSVSVNPGQVFGSSGTVSRYANEALVPANVDAVRCSSSFASCFGRRPYCVLIQKRAFPVANNSICQKARFKARSRLKQVGQSCLTKAASNMWRNRDFRLMQCSLCLQESPF